MTVVARGVENLSLSTSPHVRSLRLMPARIALVAADALVSLLYVWIGSDHISTYLLTTAVIIVLFATGGLYQPRLHLSILDDLPALLGRQILATAVVGAFLAFTDVAPSREFLLVAGLGAVAHIVLRAGVFEIVKSARKRGLVRHRTLIVGGGQVAGDIARTLRANGQYGLDPIGCVDSVLPIPETTDVLEWLGSTADVEVIAKEHRAGIILLAFGGDREAEVVELVRRRAVASHEVFLIPRMFEMDVRQRAGDHIGVIPIIRLPRRTVEGPSWRMKRAFDVTVSAVSLLLLSPLLAVVALAVRIEGGPGVLFRQERTGRDGKPFLILKFRSMIPVAPGSGDTTWTIAGDKRVGPVGKFLRASSIDELPQLWNILRGDMTIVGPRPERPYFVEQFSQQYPVYHHRHRVPAGLTGLAQVSGLRGDTSINDRAKYDNFYIESWTFWLDVKVMIRTISEVFRGGGRN